MPNWFSGAGFKGSKGAAPTYWSGGPYEQYTNATSQLRGSPLCYLRASSLPATGKYGRAQYIRVPDDAKKLTLKGRMWIAKTGNSGNVRLLMHAHKIEDDFDAYNVTCPSPNIHEKTVSIPARTSGTDPLTHIDFTLPTDLETGEIYAVWFYRDGDHAEDDHPDTLYCYLCECWLD